MIEDPHIEERRAERKVQLAAVARLPEGDPYRRSVEAEVKFDIERFGE